jgi:hypothetical protein
MVIKINYIQLMNNFEINIEYPLMAYIILPIDVLGI